MSSYKRTTQEPEQEQEQKQGWGAMANQNWQSGNA